MVRIITDTVSLGDLMNYDQDIPIFVMLGISNKWHYGRHVNKGNDVVVVEKKIIPAKKVEPKRVVLDTTEVVQLGGIFEKIGEKDESIGGAAQKVGSDN